MYIPKHFKLFELFPEDFYNQNQHKGNQLLWLIDCRVLWTLDRLRERYGPAYLNNWYWGGKHINSGFRTWDCKIGARWSQHKLGRAADPKFSEISAEEIRQEIFNNPFDPDFEHITSIETDISWLHFDVRNWDKAKNGILKIKP